MGEGWIYRDTGTGATATKVSEPAWDIGTGTAQSRDITFARPEGFEPPA